MGMEHLDMPHLTGMMGRDNQGPASNPKGELTLLPFWKSVKRRHWGFRTLYVSDGGTDEQHPAL